MDIFDVDHFINMLKDDINIVKELPLEYSWSTRDYYATAIRSTRIKTAPVHASANWYLENVLPVIERFVVTWTWWLSFLVNFLVLIFPFYTILSTNFKQGTYHGRMPLNATNFVLSDHILNIDGRSRF